MTALNIVPQRQIVQLHTIEQWFKVDPRVRGVIMQNLKVKKRLENYLVQKSKREVKPLEDPTWVPCKSCNKDNRAPVNERGWVLREPRYPGIHPSQVSDTCLLKIYNDMLGVPKSREIEPRLQLIFDLGHKLHHLFQGYGLDGAWGPNYVPEIEISAEFQPVAEQYMIEGHADADNLLIVDDIPNAPVFEVGVVHEYKSMNSNQHKDLTRAKGQHKQQGTVYSFMLNRPVTVYLYMNKDTSQLTEFPVEFSLDVWKPIAQKCGFLIDHYNRSATPPANPGYDCNECDYSKSCTPFHEYLARTQQYKGKK